MSPWDLGSDYWSVNGVMSIAYGTSPLDLLPMILLCVTMASGWPWKLHADDRRCLSQDSCGANRAGPPNLECLYPSKQEKNCIFC